MSSAPACPRRVPSPRIASGRAAEVDGFDPAGGGHGGADLVTGAGLADGGDAERLAPELKGFRLGEDAGAVDHLPNAARAEVHEAAERGAEGQQLAGEQLAEGAG